MVKGLESTVCAVISQPVMGVPSLSCGGRRYGGKFHISLDAQRLGGAVLRPALRLAELKQINNGEGAGGDGLRDDLPAGDGDAVFELQ